MTKILVLPDAGPQNPFQYQMIDLLEKNGYQVIKAPRRRFFATLSAFTKHQPDIVYFDWIQSFILGKTLILTLVKCVCFFFEVQYITRVKKKPILHTLHNICNHAGLWLSLERKIYTWFLHQCSKIRVYSEETKQTVVSVFNLNPDKIYVIQDIPYHTYYQNNVSLEESRSYLKIDSGKFVFLFLGMVKPYKGLETLIEIFHRNASSEDILVIAGASDNPEFGKKIYDLIKSNQRIIFHNQFISEVELQYFFNAADVAVLPFKNIEHSGSVDLAMSFKKPVITLKTNFLKKQLFHQADLLFENPKDLENILKSIKNKNLKEIGFSNFIVMDNSNYRELIRFFI